MRLLTYNIHSGIGNDRQYCLERIIAVIAEQNPDLICLQEVDFKLGRSRYQDQPTLLAQELGAFSSFYQLNVPQGEGGYGNLLLSRWHLLQQHSVSLTRRWRQPRGAQLVVVQTPNGPLHVVNWHLGLAETERRWQANQLLSHPLFQQSAHLPTLIAGDANDWLDTLHGCSFQRHQFQQATTPSARYRSFPAFLPLVSLERVFTRGRLDVQETRIVQSDLARRASDHRPLVLDFLLRPEEPQPSSSANGKHTVAARRAGLFFGLGWAIGRAAARVREETQNFWTEVQRLRQGEPSPCATNNGHAPRHAPLLLIPPAAAQQLDQNGPVLHVGQTGQDQKDLTGPTCERERVLVSR